MGKGEIGREDGIQVAFFFLFRFSLSLSSFSFSLFVSSGGGRFFKARIDELTWLYISKFN